MSTIKINLDFYNNTLTTINAKQHDTFARFINVTCTDQGRKVVLDKEKMSVYVGIHKSDNNDEFEHAEILSDGTININLTENMLSTSGRCYFDVIVFGKGGLTVDDIRLVFSMEDLNTSVLSTMPICLNVIGNAVSYARLEQHKNYNGLLYAIALAENMEVYLEEQEEIRQNSENDRNNAETARENAEIARNTAESLRDDAETARIDEEANRVQAESDRVIAEQSRTNAEAERDEAETNREKNVSDAIKKADDATSRATTAAEACETVVKDYSSTFVILDENGQVPIEQLGNVQEVVHKIYYGTEEPTSGIGKDGDIYMMIIE